MESIVAITLPHVTSLMHGVQEDFTTTRLYTPTSIIYTTVASYTGCKRLRLHRVLRERE